MTEIESVFKELPEIKQMKIIFGNWNGHSNTAN